jgi:hypothetical protein
MAVPEQTPYIEHTGNGVTTSFSLGFQCESKDHLIVLMDEIEPPIETWSLIDGNVVFTAAPTSGQKITLQRNTPFSRTTDYQSYNNSFRPPAVNNDFDRVWWKIQELGVRDWLLDLKIQKFRDDVNLTAMEETLEQAQSLRDDTAAFAVEVKDNVAQSQTLLANTTEQASAAASSATSANSSKDLAKQYADNIDASLTAIAGGHKAYQTLALAQAAQASLPANTIVEVTNDPTASNNGTYQWNGTTLTKSAYDPLTQAKADATTKANAAEANAKSYTDAVNEINYSTTKTPDIVYTPITGARLNTVASNPAFLLPGVNDKYLKIKVSDFKSITITGARTDVSDWKWVFTDADLKRISISTHEGNRTYVIPENAVWAYRTYFNASSDTSENPGMIISGEYKLDPLQLQISTLENEVDYLANGSPISNVVISPIYGGFINTDQTGSILRPNTDSSHLKINVQGMESLTITGTVPGPNWKWVFTDADLNKIAISTFYGNGVLLIPENAVWAYRTYTIPYLNQFETETLKIVAKSKHKTVEYVYTDLKEDISKLEILAEDNNGFYGKKSAAMLDAFNKGDILKISDFPAATQHEQIDAAIAFIKKRGWGILDLGSGVWLRNSAVLLPDNCWIYLNEATVKLADGVFDNVFRNDGIIPNPDPSKNALELRENKNIRIFGKSKDLAKVSGPDVPYTAPHPIAGGDPVPWVGDWYGWRTMAILLANVKDYKLHDFAMEKTTCWAISQEHGCENFEVFNIKFDTNVKNGDGVDVRQGCKHGKIYNITGSTSDDMVALSAIQNFVTQHPSGNYIYPLQVGGYDDRGFGGDIEDIQISNISGKGQHHGIRLLASGGSKVGRISIDNVSDSGGVFVNAIVLISSGYGTPAVMGDLFNVTVNGIESNQSITPLKISGPIKDSAFNKIRQHRTGGVLYSSTATFENTEITNAEFVV